ncbi:MAG: type II toxin-antitoxin system RelE/ParE family toxin [Syntrophales bacterium]|nr:type II toxin-antitoxin system RelE/ParE family toxin [Syntrophales bacterium]MCK9392821.1 type II toxin-antitoxin system RelE/ParE family toxin [Syntrophales bacterium]
MRVFKNKWFDRWARREDISDSTLYNTAVEIAEEKYDADLGGYLFKKRLARTGSGKRGGYRTIVGYKKPTSERIIFLYAFAKSDRANISGREEAALSLAAESFLSATDRQVDELLTSGSIWEVQHHE